MACVIQLFSLKKYQLYQLNMCYEAILFKSSFNPKYFQYRYIGQTFESGESDEDEDPDKKEAPVERRKPDAENIDGMLGDEDTKYRPDDPSLYDPTSFGDSLKESLKEQAKQFAEMFKQALFGSK